MDAKSIRKWLVIFLLPLLSLGLVACLDLSQGGGGGLLGQIGGEAFGKQGGQTGTGFPIEKWARKDDHKDKHGQTTLHRAAEDGHKKRVEELLDAGAKVDARDDDGRTPLHYAAKRGHLDVVKLLIKEGASVWKRDKKGKRPSRLALDKGEKEVHRYLRRIERRR
jgi:hypothetical protein